MSDLTPIEATAMAVWSTGSADSTQCLMAVRAAIRAERARVAEEIAHAIETQDGGDQGLPSGREGRAFYANLARQHATT